MKEEITRFEIAKLKLQPGDILVAKTELILSMDQVQYIHDKFKIYVPNNEVLVLSADMTIEVLKKEDKK